LHASPRQPDRLAAPGERIRQPAQAAALAELARAGPGLLYGSGADPVVGGGTGPGRGAWGRRLVALCEARGGHLRTPDLTGYRVYERAPLGIDYRGARLHLNPPPSIGGLLIALALDLLAAVEVPAQLAAQVAGDAGHRHRLACAMRLVEQARGAVEAGLGAGDRRPGDAEAGAGLDPALSARYRALMREAAVAVRGTTQISVADADGNLASLTLSNGEGAGRLLPGTGIVLNNMLGEADLNPAGFQRWPPDRRLSSMMCPTLVAHADGGWTVTGSGGSNRIRSAILQVLTNLIDLGLPLAEAVAAPRIHYEDGLLNVEPPVSPETLRALGRRWPKLLPWQAPSVFFGGAHSVGIDRYGGLHGAGDARRGGVVRSL
jgi:gamma-glutamyltranspeptidase/glutathione hydrolase